MENVNHPKHYNQGKIEVIEFIEDKKLDFCLANTVKYVCRAGIKDKDKEIEDLEKARWYLSRKIEQLKAAQEKRDPVRPNEMNKVSKKKPEKMVEPQDYSKLEFPVVVIKNTANLYGNLKHELSYDAHLTNFNANGLRVFNVGNDVTDSWLYVETDLIFIGGN
jgi:hypothetical protein